MEKILKLFDVYGACFLVIDDYCVPLKLRQDHTEIKKNYRTKLSEMSDFLHVNDKTV